MPTKQFKWIDRDTAARDMLQLVYHAPPQIAEQAVKLLKAIRSPAIIPELKAIFLDAEYDTHQRREIYEVICATLGNFDFSEFEVAISKTYDKLLFNYYAIRLLKYHPDNITWILHHIESTSIGRQLYCFAEIMEFVPEIASERILRILSENETSFGQYIGFQLYKFGGEPFKFWLEKNWQSIIQSWLLDDLEYETEYWWRLKVFVRRDAYLDKWPELRDRLSKISLDWLLAEVDLQNPRDQRLIAFRLLPYAPKPASDLLLKLIDEKRIFLDLETAGMLYQYGDEAVQIWLKALWDELIYLCLIDSVATGHDAEKVRIVHVLEKWAELKESLFKSAPTIVDEYNAKKASYDIGGSEVLSDNHIKASSIWQSLEQRRIEYIGHNESLVEPTSFSSWQTLIAQFESDIPKVAVEVYFLGTLTQYDKEATRRLGRLCELGGDMWKQKDSPEDETFSYTPIRFEAAYALRNIVTPGIWTTFVEVFIARPSVVGAMTSRYPERHMLRWISRMTDILSGVEPELPDEEIPLNARPWFCALVQQETNTS